MLHLQRDNLKCIHIQSILIELISKCITLHHHLFFLVTLKYILNDFQEHYTLDPIKLFLPPSYLQLFSNTDHVTVE